MMSTCWSQGLRRLTAPTAPTGTTYHLGVYRNSTRTCEPLRTRPGMPCPHSRLISVFRHVQCPPMVNRVARQCFRRLVRVCRSATTNVATRNVRSKLHAQETFYLVRLTIGLHFRLSSYSVGLRRVALCEQHLVSALRREGQAMTTGCSGTPPPSRSCSECRRSQPAGQGPYPLLVYVSGP